MVITSATALVAGVTLWERLSPLERARLGLALIAFLVLFLAVIGFVILLARMARREARKPLPPIRDLPDAWARKPLAPVPPATSDDGTPSADEADPS